MGRNKTMKTSAKTSGRSKKVGLQPIPVCDDDQDSAVSRSSCSHDNNVNKGKRTRKSSPKGYSSKEISSSVNVSNDSSAIGHSSGEPVKKKSKNASTTVA